MNDRELLPWNRERQGNVTPRGDIASPFVTLHREMNRLFDEAFRVLDLAPFDINAGSGRTMAWPNIEVNETDKEISVTADLPGLEEKDVAVELVNGGIVIQGEKKISTEEKNRLFSERFYGRFQRRVPAEDIDKDKVQATFSNGVLTVTMPKTKQARQQVKRIAINSG